MDTQPKQEKKRQREQFEAYYRDEFEVAKDTACGYSIFRRGHLQWGATKKLFIVVNGFAGCLIIGCFTYFSGSISSIEKLYGIPSQRSGIISVGNDISQVLVGLFIAYYLGNKHKPRWMAIGILCFALYCGISMLPHLLYDTSEDVLLLTKEFGNSVGGRKGSSNLTTLEFVTRENQKKMCQLEAPVAWNGDSADCENSDNYMPQVILFIAQICAGIGNAIYSALNGAYLDDNVEKSKAPWVISKFIC